MKKYFNKVGSMLLAVLVAFSMVIGSTGAAFASSSWIVGPEENYGFTKASTTVYAYNMNNGKDAKITSVKSSNTKVVKVSNFYWYDEKNKKHKEYQLDYKKAGTAKVTIKYKLPSGTVKTEKKTITVKPYPNQIKSLKVNGKTISTKKHPYYFDKKYKGTKAKVKIKIKDGWKISGADIYVSNDKTGKEIKGAKAKIKNGKTISFPKKYKYLSVNITMTNKDGEMINYNVWMYR